MWAIKVFWIPTRELVRWLLFELDWGGERLIESCFCHLLYVYPIHIIFSVENAYLGTPNNMCIAWTVRCFPQPPHCTPPPGRDTLPPASPPYPPPGRDTLLSQAVRRDTVSTRWPWYVAAVGCIVDVLVDVRVQFTAVMTDAVPSLLLYSLDDGYSTPLSPILGVRTSGTYVRSTYRYVFSTYVPPPT